MTVMFCPARSQAIMMSVTRTARRFMSRRPVVGGNWKCNPVSASKLPELVANIEACDTSKVDVYVCPTPLHTALVSFKNGAKVAPQNMNFTGCGAYTGEMAADQMVDMGIEVRGHTPPPRRRGSPKLAGRTPRGPPTRPHA